MRPPRDEGDFVASLGELGSQVSAYPAPAPKTAMRIVTSSERYRADHPFCSRTAKLSSGGGTGELEVPETESCPAVLLQRLVRPTDHLMPLRGHRCTAEVLRAGPQVGRAARRR